jgi:hypothetical protein
MIVKRNITNNRSSMEKLIPFSGLDRVLTRQLKFSPGTGLIIAA